MRSSPSALLALWNDVESHRVEEYEFWHSQEHVPERLWVSGFLGATRFLRVLGSMPTYFTLYELSGLNVLDSQQYLELVQRPTQWSSSMRSSLKHFVRMPVEMQHISHTPSVVPVGGIVVARAWPRVPKEEALAKYIDVISKLNASNALNASYGVGCSQLRGPQAIPNEHGELLRDEALIWCQTGPLPSPEALKARLRDLAYRIESSLSKLTQLRIGCYQTIGERLVARDQGRIRPLERVDLYKKFASRRVAQSSGFGP